MIKKVIFMQHVHARNIRLFVHSLYFILLISFLFIYKSAFKKTLIFFVYIHSLFENTNNKLNMCFFIIYMNKCYRVDSEKKTSVTLRGVGREVGQS